MKYSAEQYASALFEALSEVGPKDHNTIIENFITVLQKQNELEHYESIIEAYERLDKEKRGEHAKLNNLTKILLFLLA
jgi:F0F1-type ATP synthase delta subunit